MLCLSQTTGYAVLALACLEGPEGAPCLVRNVATCTGIPGSYLANLIHALAQKGLVLTKRGYRGGIVLAKPASEITIADIADAVDGSNWLGACLLGLAECTQERACPTHKFWERERGRIERELQKTSLADVAAFERKLGIRVKCDCPDNGNGVSESPYTEAASAPVQVVRRTGKKAKTQQEPT